MREPLFILCPGRSFSSVVSTVIGQHPECYGVPELNLFIGRTVGEAWANDSRRVLNPMQGLKRTVAELEFGGQTDATVEQAEAWIRARFDWTGGRMLRHVCDAAGDRIVVEKSPANVVHPDILAEIVRHFPRASYLQLLRHPRPRGVSHVKNLEIARKRRLGPDAPTNVPDAEFKWLGTHTMIAQLGQRLALGQLLWIRGEDLMRDLRRYLPQIAEWLGISTAPEAIEAMLRPEDSPYARPGPRKARFGTNADFLQNPKLDFDRLAAMPEASLDGPLDWAPAQTFSPATRRLAGRYGYR